MTTSSTRRNRQRENRRKKIMEKKCAKIIQRAFRNFRELKTRNYSAIIIQKAIRKRLKRMQLSALVIQRAFRNSRSPQEHTYENVITHESDSSDEEYEEIENHFTIQNVYDTLYGYVHGFEEQDNSYSFLNRNVTFPNYVPFAPAFVNNNSFDIGIYVENVIERGFQNRSEESSIIEFGIQNTSGDDNGYYQVVNPN